MKFQALVNDQAFDLTLDGDTVTIDGSPAEISFQRVSANEVLLLLDGRSYPFTAETQDDGTVRLTHAGRAFGVRVKTERDLLLEEYGVEAGAGAAERELRAPMPGLVLSVLVEEGQEVEEGAGLVVLEAMKMENELRAATTGTVAKVHVEAGSPVGKNDLLVSFAD